MSGYLAVVEGITGNISLHKSEYERMGKAWE